MTKAPFLLGGIDPTAATPRQSFGGGRRALSDLGPLNQAPRVVAVAVLDLLELTTVGELLERVGPRGLQQPVAGRPDPDLRRGRATS